MRRTFSHAPNGGAKSTAPPNASSCENHNRCGDERNVYGFRLQLWTQTVLGAMRGVLCHLTTANSSAARQHKSRVARRARFSTEERKRGRNNRPLPFFLSSVDSRTWLGDAWWPRSRNSSSGFVETTTATEIVIAICALNCQASVREVQLFGARTRYVVPHHYHVLYRFAT